jgi:hypothetical protein
MMGQLLTLSARPMTSVQPLQGSARVMRLSVARAKRTRAARAAETQAQIAKKEMFAAIDCLRTLAEQGELEEFVFVMQLAGEDGVHCGITGVKSHGESMREKRSRIADSVRRASALITARE